MLFMKIVSLNIRGLGGGIKRRELKKFVKKERLDLLCIQETKMEWISQEVCNSIWDDVDFSWSYLPSIGNSGGILCLWRNSSFNFQQLFGGNHFVGLKGRWGIDFECAMIFVYAPCDVVGKKRLWGDILASMEDIGGMNWCVAGDFNEARFYV